MRERERESESGERYMMICVFLVREAFPCLPGTSASSVNSRSSALCSGSLINLDAIYDHSQLPALS